MIVEACVCRVDYTRHRAAQQIPKLAFQHSLCCCAGKPTTICVVWRSQVQVRASRQSQPSAQLPMCREGNSLKLNSVTDPRFTFSVAKRSADHHVYTTDSDRRKQLNIFLMALLVIDASFTACILRLPHLVWLMQLCWWHRKYR